jgi:hypothetical protein
MRVRRRPGGAREVGPGHGLSDRAAMPQQGGQTGIQALFSLGGDADSAPTQIIKSPFAVKGNKPRNGASEARGPLGARA